MLKVAPVFNARDTTGLCRVYDKIEIHHRGFKALDVNASTHKGIIVPAVLGKLREGVKLQITCRKNYTEWKMEDLLKELLSELELREHCTMNKSEGSQYTHIDKDKKRKEDERNTANALLAQMNNFCAYCIVKLVEERRQSLPKYGRCFICVRKAIFPTTVILNLLAVLVKGKITFLFAMRATAQTGIVPVAPTMVIVMTCQIPIVPVMLVSPTLPRLGEQRAKN